MHTAFDAASGGTAGMVAMAIVLAVAASVVVWGANAVRTLLLELMREPGRFARNGWLVVRVLMIVMVMVHFLV
jgi:hypothetical protein